VSIKAATEPASTPRPQSVGRIAAWLAKQVELAATAMDLSLAQYRILGLLDSGPAVSSALADRLAVRPPSVTALVDGLVARGFVDRRAVQDDRRRVSHVLTPAGRKVLTATDNAVEARLTAIAGSLTDATCSARAIDDLRLWGEAIRTYHGAATR